MYSIEYQQCYIFIQNFPMSPEIVVSHIVKEEACNKYDRNKLCFVSYRNHQNHRHTKNDRDDLKDSKLLQENLCFCFGNKNSRMKIQKYENGTLYLNNYIFRLPIKVNQSHKHENEKKTSRELQILLKFKSFSLFLIIFNSSYKMPKCFADFWF